MAKPANRIEEKGGRVLLFGTFYTAMKRELMKLAENKCERCGKFTLAGDVHHIIGRGGGKRDDRIFIDGKRNLEYHCRVCHDGRHVPAKVVPAKPTNDEFLKILGLGQ